MPPARTVIGITLALGAGLGLAGCLPPAPGPAVTATTPAPVPPAACSFLTLAEAAIALGTTTDPRRESSTTTDSRTFCTFRGASEATELVVLAADGGGPPFERELGLDESDLHAVRQPVAGLDVGYLISGTELAAAKVVVGVRADDRWFTVSLQIAGADRTTLERRAVAVARTAERRLTGAGNIQSGGGVVIPVGVPCVPGPHHFALAEYRSAGAASCHSPRGDQHTDTV